MTDIADQLRQSLQDRYTIQRQLGAGGMATVWLAEDLKHHRRVAIKVLRPELAASLGSERFLREIETTASLRHPHILPLYDSGEAGGFLFYVMPLVEGESLRDRLAREKQLPIDDALRIAREVADALSYAHARGVIHRDIKPENILLESGHAVVADFGIARAVRAAEVETLTQTGVSIGTPAYMSPEQAAGEQDLDGRSDLYALACVLFEMLAGQPPFTGPSSEAITRQHLVAEAPPITNFRPAVPAAVSAALQRALAKTPADRFNPVAQFAEAIGPAAILSTSAATAAAVSTPAQLPASPRRRALVRAMVTVLGLLAIAAVATVWTRQRGDSTVADARSIAVLPFADMSPDHSNGYLSDGVAETLINALANVPGFEVAARTSAFSFRDKGIDVREIGRQLGVATVLEGSVQRSGDQLRVTAQLVKTADAVNLWSKSFDGRAADIFAIQDEVASAVVTALRGQLDGAAVTSPGTGNPAAYDAYLQGRFYWNKRSVADLDRAVEYFNQAIALDSSYAVAWSGLADAYMMYPFYSTAPAKDYVPRARVAAEHALEVDPDLAEAHTTLGYALTIYYWDWTTADSEFRRAIALNPKYATAHKWYSDMLQAVGDPDSALAEAQRAARLEPKSPNIRTIVFIRLWMLGRDAEARAELDSSLALDPTYPLTLLNAPQFYWLLRDTAAFFSIQERLNVVSPQLGIAPVALLRRAYAAGGPDSVLRLQVKTAAARLNPNGRAVWEILLHDLDGAYRDLNEAVDQHNVWVGFTISNPVYVPTLEADPRYTALLKRMGLPWHSEEKNQR